MTHSSSVTDIITGRAKEEAGRIRKFRDADEARIDQEENGLPIVPMLHISRQRQGTVWDVTSSGEQSHPNEGRMEFIREWLKQEVLNDDLSSSEGDLNGTYRIELHDSSSYLPHAEDYRNVLCFSRTSEPTAASIALFPDPYQSAGYGPDADVQDSVLWANKRPTVLFAGSTTGDPDPSKNARIRACVWALDHPGLIDFRISSVVQMRPYDVIRKFPEMLQILAPPLTVGQHFQYRFIANIVGNTACWSRVPMVMQSSSVLFHVPHSDMTWYQPLLHSGDHYVECTTHNEILRQRQACDENPNNCLRIIREANVFRRTYMTRGAAASYARHLLYDVRGK